MTAKTSLLLIISLSLNLPVLGGDREVIAKTGSMLPIFQCFAKSGCSKKTDGTAPCQMPKLKIPAGGYFLLADNRAESEDSRLWLPQTIPKSEVLGKVVKIIAH